jgi:hypothetical protein
MAMITFAPSSLSAADARPKKEVTTSSGQGKGTLLVVV